MEPLISATEAARGGGEPVCRIVPAGPTSTLADLSNLLSTIPKPDPAFWDEVEALTKNQLDAPALSL